MMALAVMLAIGAIAFTVAPLVAGVEEPMPEPAGDQARLQLEGRRKAIYASIRDLEFDLAMGKLSAEDHRLEHASLMADAREVVEALDQAAEGGVSDAWIESEVAARRLVAPTAASPGVAGPTAACPSCGRDIPARARFCDGCGQSLAGATCRGCGARLRADARFCNHCGARR